ncbi:protein of unknown function [Nitrospina watsonii]|uniref:Uncharacterized protein n=1 Tax=Nitrospina watsonii TaxID=1323948 RepID=A0ABM9HG51_9BACT|nr:protein of unknown function [Nitrospina watsonii]
MGEDGPEQGFPEKKCPHAGLGMPKPNHGHDPVTLLNIGTLGIIRSRPRLSTDFVTDHRRGVPAGVDRVVNFRESVGS